VCYFRRAAGRGKVRPMDSTHLASLAASRATTSAAFGRRRDALVEVCDTLLTTGPGPSLPFLSIQPQHQCRWGSLDDALAVGHIHGLAREHLLTSHPLAGGEPLSAVAGSGWPRCAAATSPERAIDSHSSRPSAGQPMVAGGASAWIAPLGFARESWTAPRRVRRLRPQAHSPLVAAAHSTALRPQLPPAGTVPWFVCDTGDDPVRLTPALGDAHAAIRLRRRADRCFDAAPTAPPRTGRPRRHGHTVAGDQPATWLPPAGDLRGEDDRSGTVRVRAWRGLHPKPHGEQALRDARGRRPMVRGTWRLVAVSRLPQRTRKPLALWRGWHGPPEAEVPDWDRAWRASVRRCDREQTFRFPETHAPWDRPTGAPPRTSRPLDLARHLARRAGLLAGAPGATARPRPAAAVAAPPVAWHPHPRARASCVCAPAAAAAHPRLRATTLRALSRETQRQALWSCDTLSGPHEGSPERRARRLNQTAFSSSFCQRLLPSFVARLLTGVNHKFRAVPAKPSTSQRRRRRPQARMSASSG
jgi:hypothetical protein